MRRLTAVLGLLIGILSACRQHDLRIVSVKVPGLRGEPCARLIAAAVMNQPGVREARPDIQTRTVTVTYDSMVIALKNIEYTIARAGFDANSIRADAEAAARLPPECRPEPGGPGP